MKVELRISNENFEEITTTMTDILSVNEYYKNAKNETIEFASYSIAFLFLMRIYSLKKELQGTKLSYSITDFLQEKTIKPEGDFYQLYEPLFIAESFYPEIEAGDKDTLKEAIVVMYLGIAEYLLITYRYLECLEYIRDILKFDSKNQTALFFRGLCSEMLLQFNYNLQQKTITLLCDIFQSINPNDVHFDKNIVNAKLAHYKKIDISCLKEAGLVFTKATKKILAEIPFWNDEKTYYLTNVLLLNPLIEVDCFVECINESILPTGVSQEISDLFNGIVSDFNFFRQKLYYYDILPDKNKRELIAAFSFIFSIFDKIAYLLYKYFNLDMNEGKVYLHSIFDVKLRDDSSIKLIEIKNQYLFSLYHIGREYSKSDLYCNPSNAISKNIKKERNTLLHRSTNLVDDESIYVLTSYLAKVIKRSIIYTNLILYMEELRKQLNLSYTDLIFYDNFYSNLINSPQMLKTNKIINI